MRATLTFVFGLSLLLAPPVGADDADSSLPGLVAKPDLFPTLVNPPCSHCKDEAVRRAGELLPGERVACWIRGKYEGGAIPLRFFLVPYRVISDTYGVFVYDADAGYVRGFEPSLDFTFHGFHKGVMVIRHKDGTLYSALSGRGLAGPNKDQALKPVATLATNWGPWLRRYPDTVAYHMFPKYTAHARPKQATAASRATRPEPDSRLDADAMVLGLALGSKTVAYPLDFADETVWIKHDKLGDLSVMIAWYGPTQTGIAFAPYTDDDPTRKLTFFVDVAAKLTLLVDHETGSRWDIAGRAVAGPLKGKTLRWLPGVTCKWFAWAAEYPKTSIAGK